MAADVMAASLEKLIELVCAPVAMITTSPPAAVVVKALFTETVPVPPEPITISPDVVETVPLMVRLPVPVAL